MWEIAFGFLLGGLVPTWVLLDYLKAKRAAKKYKEIIRVASTPLYNRVTGSWSS